MNCHSIGFTSGNGPWHLDAVQDYVYSSSGEVYDVSNPAAPTLISSMSINGLGTAVKVVGDHVLFGTGMIGNFYIYNISNPQVPTWVSTFPFPGFQTGIWEIDVNDSIAFLACGRDGLVAMDISDLTNPVPLDTILDTIAGPATWYIRNLVVHEDKLYAATLSGLWVVDITDPRNLTIDSKYGGAYYSIDLDTDNLNRVFLGKGQAGGIEVVDISNPNAPFSVGNVANPSGVGEVIRYQDCLVYQGTYGAVYVYDVRQNQPVLWARYEGTITGQAVGLDLWQGLFYQFRGGLHVVELDSGIAACSPITQIEPPLDQHVIEVYPNPAVANMYAVWSSSGEKVHWELLDASGSRLAHGVENDGIAGERKLDFEVQELPIGMFFLRIVEGDRTLTRKFFKQ